MKKPEKKEWDRIAQSFYECFNSALIGLKREKYISLDDYEHLINELQDRLKEPEA